MTRTYTILIIVVAVILGAYFALPQRRFEETVFPLVQGEQVIAYDDQSDGGGSRIEYLASDSVMNFSCTLGADSSRGGWCGILFNLSDVEREKFRKWNFVDSIYLDVESSGTEEIVMKIFTFDSDVSDLEKPKSFRLLLKEIPLLGGRQKIAVSIEDFYTPEFWFEEYGKNASPNRRFLESAARLEITSGWSQPRGKKYSLMIRGISVSGISNLYFGIALGAAVLVIVVAIGFRHPRKSEDGK
ncbi:MAG: hypothetical protein HUK20_05020 [Fibrobacter sp.]|nr:hypothetical protein [Fibrobacter sp.]